MKGAFVYKQKHHSSPYHRRDKQKFIAYIEQHPTRESIETGLLDLISDKNNCMVILGNHALGDFRATVRSTGELQYLGECPSK